jgi:glycosyltransferase involved in cell wall biosynthesis
MYCGSCFRDSALAVSLKRLGHSVTLIPLFTPLRTEDGTNSAPEVFYGGVNIYLQHASPVFRHTPRVLDWLFDRPWLLNILGRYGSRTPPEKLAGLTLDIIQGEGGGASKELHRLLEFLRDHVKPQVICLPNLMFVGCAKLFREMIGVPVVCELTGEDIFLDAMRDADRKRIRNLVRERARDVSRFVATTDYYAGRMAEYLDVPRERIDVVPTGLSDAYFSMPPAAPRAGNQPTVGYLARICPQKGLDRLVEAFALVRRMPALENVRLKAAGYLGKKDQPWYHTVRRRASELGLDGHIDWLAEVDRDAKLAMLDSIDVFSVPTAYPEAKGISILEALSRGVPVVQPSHGSFPELVGQTGGGLLVPPGDAGALADALARLLRDPAERRRLGDSGSAAVREKFTERRMAEGMLRVFEELTVAGTAAPETDLAAVR